MSAKAEPVFNVPPCTLALIVINIVVFLLQIHSNDNLTDRFAFVPARLLALRSFSEAGTLITYQFLHGGWLHLGMNMLGVLAFGSAVERWLGGPRYLLLYIVCGIGAALVNVSLAPDLHSLIGASGAISGLMGFVLMRLQRRGRLQMILVVIASMVVFGLVGMPGVDAPIAWAAHIGGFLMGVGAALFIKNKIKR